MLNITVSVFSFGVSGDESRSEWKEVSPDPQMAATAHFPKGWVPDLYLYNSDQSHYDLLVAEDHRLALLGLIGCKRNEEKDTNPKGSPNNTSENPSDDGWTSVSHKKKHKNVSDKLLSENQQETYDEKDLEELDEEADLAKAKESGHRRIDPSVPSESVSKEKQMFKCSWKDCKMQLESKGLLKSHMNEHEPIFHCDVCGVYFTDACGLKEHIGSKHDGIR